MKARLVEQFKQLFGPEGDIRAYFAPGACESGSGNTQTTTEGMCSMRVDIRYICDCKKERR